MQPGWFPGHSSAQFYVNIGINEPGEPGMHSSHHRVYAKELMSSSTAQHVAQCSPSILHNGAEQRPVRRHHLPATGPTTCQGQLQRRR